MVLPHRTLFTLFTVFINDVSSLFSLLSSRRYFSTDMLTITEDQYEIAADEFEMLPLQVKRIDTGRIQIYNV